MEKMRNPSQYKKQGGHGVWVCGCVCEEEGNGKFPFAMTMKTVQVRGEKGCCLMSRWRVNEKVLPKKRRKLVNYS